MARLILGATLILATAVGAYYYNKLDNKVTAYCQAGVSALRSQKDLRTPAGLEETLSKCSENSFSFKYSVLSTKASIEQMACARGIGIAVHYYYEESEWRQYYFLVDNKILMDLINDCEKKAEKLHVRELANY